MMDYFRQRLHNAMRIFRGNDVSLPTAARGSFGARFALPPLNVRWLLLRAPALLGRTGVVGIGLLIACTAFYFSTIQQAQKQLSSTRKNVQFMQEQLKQAGQGAHTDQRSSEEQIVRFYHSFPLDKDLPGCMEKIFATAQSSGIELEQGEYKVTRESSNGLVRFQMTFPVKADYPRVRKFLSSLKADSPTLSLQQVQFKRQQVGDAMVEANIRLVLYLLEPKS